MISKIENNNIVIKVDEFFKELILTDDFNSFVQKLQSFVISRTFESDSFEVFVEILNRCETDIKTANENIKKIHNYNSQELKEINRKLDEIKETNEYMTNDLINFKIETSNNQRRLNNKINLYFIILLIITIALFLLTR